MDEHEIEEPFRKRPRLSMFPSDDQLDDDLGGRRTRNDLLLKSRFESIFDKYSHDFSGIGDEIDTVSGDVVVDNGHIQSMENETDPGGLHNARGQTLLRAITEAINDEEEGDYYNPDADEVRTSIEEIAASAAMAEVQRETTPMDSDEELFLPVLARASYITPPDSRESHITVHSESASDHESLFDAHPAERSTSPDSLFEVKRESTDSDLTNPLLEFTRADEEMDDTSIMQKFGPQVGREVLSIIQRARNAAYQAHIEPAWRIPTSIVPPEQFGTSSKSRTPVPLLATPPELHETVSPEHAKSLWAPTRFRSTKRAVRQASATKRIRAESPDPLQEDFADNNEKCHEELDNGDLSDWLEEERPKKIQKRGKQIDEQVVQMKKGICFYCQRQWSGRVGVYKHWVKLATQFDRGEIDDDDIHDLEYIHSYVATSSRASRGPRLMVSDFKTLVELHEGAGISFDEIAEIRALRTKKNGLALNDVYDRYRTVTDELANDSAEWSNEELQTLQELCKNPKRDMNHFASSFENRSSLEIGDKLADIWLGELIDSGQIFARAVQQQWTALPTRVEDGDARPQFAREPSMDELFIKEEPGSDDELFGRG
ncbi:hypothetical protein H2200_006367 [Cladophialophora chaetospira]|uniref:Uncharacterized protein n=1 Tax=Cladophialophora chaetospira TaxID=386627 RepID=A0AA38XAS4_9EURO|nr:hypothetical protein H2200_006367 [Cladophialophora chaetospira]